MLSALFVTGCATPATVTTTEGQCAGWTAFDYNSKKKDSSRHAGPVLAKDLATHNQRGRNTGCWE